MRILYYYSKLNIGGAERSTVRLLNSMVQNGHETTLLLRWNGGLLENELDSRIRIIHLKKGNISNSRAVQKVFIQIREKIGLCYRLGKLGNEQFDIVISGLFGYNPKILFKWVKAKQYYQLLRNDVTETGKYGKTIQYMNQYGEKFDAYIGVSQYTTDSFKLNYSQLEDKAHTIYNILPEIDVDDIKLKANPMIGYEDKMKILTVCRLADKAKGLYRMVHVCEELRKTFGDSFVWFIVGDGPDREELKQRITSANLQNQMILCGEQNNPFPYYIHADLVAVLSYYEGLCGVVNEAKIIKRPVIATEFSGIYEQIKSGINGIIVKNNTEAIVSGLKDLMSHPEDLKRFAINGMSPELTDNEKKIKQYEALFEQIEERKKNG